MQRQNKHRPSRPRTEPLQEAGITLARVIHASVLAHLCTILAILAERLAHVIKTLHPRRNLLNVEAPFLQHAVDRLQDFVAHRRKCLVQLYGIHPARHHVAAPFLGQHLDTRRQVLLLVVKDTRISMTSPLFRVAVFFLLYTKPTTGILSFPIVLRL